MRGRRLDTRAAGTAVAAAILLSSCATFMNSELAGHLLGAARGFSAGAGGIEGTVLDVTNNAVVVQDEVSHTIFTIRAPSSNRDKVEPGLTVRAAGSFDNGVLVPQGITVTGGSPWHAPVTHDPKAGRIEHVLLLMQENHSFDNYFGAFPGVDGPPTGLTVEGVSPFHLGTPVTQNLSHSLSTARAALHEGRMDRFVSAEGSRDTMGFYDQRDIPSYWTYAAHFTLADRFFCSAVGPSMPNHLFAVAARSDGVTANIMKPPEGGFAFPALPERLQSAGVSWKAYVGDKDPEAFTALNPLPGFQSFKQNAALRSGLVPNVELFRDLRNGTLPSMGWIFPNGEESEHPLTDIRVGMRYVTAIVNALMKSGYWRDTVLVVTWDEYGGFFDHAPPPQIDSMGYGPRVPALIISAHARAGFVDHTVYDFCSVLRFIEDLHGIVPLSARDGTAASIAGALDLSQPPLAPLLIDAQ